MKRYSLILAAVWTVFASDLAFGAKTSAGLTLLEAPSARPAALGEAFSAVPNDVAAFHYNPAALHTLESNQVSFLFQRGITEDRFGQVLLGLPHESRSLGMSLSYYSTGDINVYDGVSQRTVNGQTDLIFGMGGATQVKNFNLGMTAKYISSEIAETVSASALAADLGMNIQLSNRTNIGASVQNIGQKLKYVQQSDELPRIARAGFSHKIRTKSLLVVDVPYDFSQSELNPALGLETMVGPLALRAGYKHGSDLEEFSIGTGFGWGSTSLDYSFGLVDKLDARHIVSLAYKFGEVSITPLTRVTPKDQAETNVQETKTTIQPTPQTTLQAAPKYPVFEVKPLGGEGQLPQLRVYTVKQGDTLKTIAKSMLGSEKEWEKIYNANKHMLSNPEKLAPGQKILLPRKEK